MLIVLRKFLQNDNVIVLSYFQNGIRRHYHAFQPKTLNNINDNSNNNNVNINMSNYLEENNSLSIEIEIIMVIIQLFLILNIDSPLIFPFINYDKVIINKNIPKNYQQIKLTLPSSRISLRIYNSSSDLTSNNSIEIEDSYNNYKIFFFI
jgi:hypothetical protein